MSATMTNGKARKSLSEQIDRLDAVLDGLADNLNQAIAAAVKEAVGLAVREAVRAVVTEVLAQPTLLAQLGNAVVPDTTTGDDVTKAATTPKVGLRTRLASVKSWIGRQVRAVGVACRSVVVTMLVAAVVVMQRACQACVTTQHVVVRSIRTGWQHLQLVGHYLVRVLSAFATGLATGIAATCLQPCVVLVIAAMAGVMVGWMAPMVLWRRASVLTARAAS